MIVDVIKCGTCLGRLPRTVRMVKRGTRHHAGACAAAASREALWRAGRLDGHMAMMRTAASRGRLQRLRRRLERVAPDVPFDRARALYESGYKAGYRAKCRRSRRAR